MTQGRRANDRLDVLIEKLGLHEYEASKHIAFYKSLVKPGEGKGILHELSEASKEDYEYIIKLIRALMQYLEVDLVKQESTTFKMVKASATTKRKYVKSGKYSKKNKNV